MKKQIKLFVLLLITSMATAFGQVGIGTENPDSSSILDLTSTEKGFLPPRMTESERDVINNPAGPAEGLVIYNTDKKCLEFWNSTKWVSFCEAAAPAPAVDGITCSAAFDPATITAGEIYSGTFVLNYTGGNNVAYPAQSFTTEGFTFTAPAGTLATGAGTVTYTVTAPASITAGSKTLTIDFLGETCTKIVTVAPAPAPAGFMVSSPTYQGISVINSTGIGYNGEVVPSNSTITVQANVTTAGAYTLTATDAGTGLVYSATGTFASAGTHPVVLTPNTVTIDPYTVGVLTMPVTGANNTLDLTPRIDYKSLPTAETEIVPVNFAGYTWMDRNLGAHRVPTSTTDHFGFGNYFQWGRPADGHEMIVRNGTNLQTAVGLYPVTTTLANTDTPGHNNFILNNTTPFDWRSDNNDNRWAIANQGPCPTGYHVPTLSQLDEARLAFGTKNAAGAFASALKLPSAGNRNHASGSFLNQGTIGYYWSSTVLSTQARLLYFSSNSNSANMNSNNRALGFSVRCLKE